MVVEWRKVGVLGGVLLAGVAVGALGMMSLRGGDGPYATSPPLATRTMGAPATAAYLRAVAGNCEMAPLLAPAGEGDGQVELQANAAAASAHEVGALILRGKEAAASGRRRDAEITFLNACRHAAALQGDEAIPLADALYQLARHYANMAAFGAPGNADLFRRAERLYSASLEGYRARYGAEHEKTRFAQEGLATVQQVTEGKAAAEIAKAAPEPTPALSAAPAEVPPEARVAEAAASGSPTAAASSPAPASHTATRADPVPAPAAKTTPPSQAPRQASGQGPASPATAAASPASATRAPPQAAARSEPQRGEPQRSAQARSDRGLGAAPQATEAARVRRAPVRTETAEVDPNWDARLPPPRAHAPRPMRMPEGQPQSYPPALPPPSAIMGANSAERPATAEGSAGVP